MALKHLKPALALKARGYTYKQIANKLGTSETTISRTINYHGHARKNRKLTDDEKTLILRTDLKAREIGDLIGMDEERVRDCRFRLRKSKHEQTIHK